MQKALAVAVISLLVTTSFSEAQDKRDTSLPNPDETPTCMSPNPYECMMETTETDPIRNEWELEETDEELGDERSEISQSDHLNGEDF